MLVQNDDVDLLQCEYDDLVEHDVLDEYVLEMQIIDVNHDDDDELVENEPIDILIVLQHVDDGDEIDERDYVDIDDEVDELIQYVYHDEYIADDYDVIDDEIEVEFDHHIIVYHDVMLPIVDEVEEVEVLVIVLDVNEEIDDDDW